MLRSFWRELAYSLRTWRATPAAGIVAVLSLALAIGGNAVVFGLINGLLWRPLPFPEADRVVLLGEAEQHAAPAGLTGASEANFLDWRERQSFFVDLAGLRRGLWAQEAEGETRQVRGAAVTPSFFELLGARPVAGRLLRGEEARPGAEAVAVVTAGFAGRLADGDPGAAVGRSIVLDGVPHTVVGVLPTDFEFLDPDIRLYVPLRIRPGEVPRHRQDLFVVGRLREGVSEAEAASGMAVIGQGLAREYPAANSGREIRVTNLREEIPDPRNRRLYGLLQGALIFVLLIACANVANLLLAHAEGRSRDTAIRFSVGATRRRVARVLLLDSGAVVAAGGLLGLGLGALVLELLSSLLAGQLPAYSRPVLDSRVVLFTVGVTVLAGLVFGTAPLVRSLRLDLVSTLKQGGRSADVGGRRWAAQALVVAQIALALMLLAGSAMLIRGVSVLQRSDPGFRTDRLLTVHLRLPESLYPEPERAALATEEIVARLRALPAVEEAAASNRLPRGPFVPSVAYHLDAAQPGEEAAMPRADWLTVSPGYFSTLGVEVRRGRAFEAADTADGAAVLIANQELVRRHWPDGDGLGRQVHVQGRPYRLVGVVADVRHGFLGGARHRVEPTIYLPLTQEPSRSVRLVVRGSTAPRELIDEVRSSIVAYNPSIPVEEVQPLDTALDRLFVGSRLISLILTAFGALALALACLGTYGVASYRVSRRTQEIGIRMALGSTRPRIIRLILGQSFRLAVLGALIGVPGVVLVTTALGRSLAGVVEIQPVLVVLVGVLLVAVTVVAALFPALRAAAVDPMRALRSG